MAFEILNDLGNNRKTGIDSAGNLVHRGGLAWGTTPVALTATPAELNAVADVSASRLELTATAAIPAGTRAVELNHATVVIAATYTVEPGVRLSIKDTSATGTAAHTVTLTGGTFNGTNTIATLNARDEFLFVEFDSAGRGQVIVNVGSVALSGP